MYNPNSTVTNIVVTTNQPQQHTACSQSSGTQVSVGRALAEDVAFAAALTAGNWYNNL